MRDVTDRLPFRDREEAGRLLAESLTELRARGDVLVLALPRGGVPVAVEVAAALDAPLDVIVVRKLGFPGQPELAMGALASGGVRLLNHRFAKLVDSDLVEAEIQEQLVELNRREQVYRGQRAPFDARGQTVVLVDDGLATGSTMRAAIAAVREHEPASIIVAVPIGASQTVATLEDQADEVICPAQPADFYAVGQFYQRFDQLTDDQVREQLGRAWQLDDRAPRVQRTAQQDPTERGR